MKLSEAEWQVMNALWKKHPASAREIAEQIPEGTNWAYTTIKTMLARLVTKQAVSESKKGNTSFYEPLVSQKKARGSAIKNLLNHAFEGATGSLVHFLIEEKKLTKKQREELLQILQEENKGGKNG